MDIVGLGGKIRIELKPSGLGNRFMLFAGVKISNSRIFLLQHKNYMQFFGRALVALGVVVAH